MKFRNSQYPTRRSARKVKQEVPAAPQAEIDLMISGLKTRDGRAIANGKALGVGLKKLSDFGKEEFNGIIRALRNNGYAEEAVDLLMDAKKPERAIEICETKGLDVQGAEIARLVGDSARLAAFAGRVMDRAAVNRQFHTISRMGSEYGLFEMALAKLGEADAYAYGYKFARQHLGQKRAHSFLEGMIEKYKKDGKWDDLHGLTMYAASNAVHGGDTKQAISFFERGLMFEMAAQLVGDSDSNRSLELYERAVERKLEQNNHHDAVSITFRFIKDTKRALEMCQNAGLYEAGIAISESSGETRWAQWMREKAIEMRIKEGDIAGAHSLMLGDKRLLERAAHFCETNGRLDVLSRLLEQRGDLERANKIARLDGILRRVKR